MQITIDFPDRLHRELKQKAEAEKTSMRQIVIRSLERALYSRSDGRPVERINGLRQLK